MEEKKLNSEESLEIITRMIHVARGNVRSASFYFLFWGWLGVVGTLGQFLLETQAGYKYPYIIWLISIPGVIITFWYTYKKAKKSRVRTYSDGLIMNTWIGFMGCVIIVIIGGKYFNYQITALIMLFTGFATFISGLVINFRPLYLASILFWILTPVALYVGTTYSPLVMTIAIVAGYLLPAYILRSQK